MAITTRQTSLLVQQDWTKIYQTFREADFQSFDFETLRKSMIEYLRTYYPEDFNDFTESSEYIALIDLIAFLGQSLAFRTDLNARENFIDTAERRDSILKLARLLSYSPKRNTPASGLLKFNGVSTTETVFDSLGNNLSNLIINWNDTSNDNWLEQFTAVINAALVANQAVSKPGATQTLNNVKTDEYTIDLINNIIPTYSFNATIAGATFPFEAISATSAGQAYLYESDPAPTGKFNILYRNDNLGNESNNTGYFIHFKQGELKSLDFNITETLPNRVVNINFDNINNSDVWLYSLSSAGVPTEKWQQVAAVNGINVIYNNITDRNLFSVATRANDQIDLIFGDGAFTNIPVGRFRIYYRQSNNLTYKITPDEMTRIAIAIPYRGRTGRAETLTIRASLKYTITNASARETLESIRTKAPQQYYTQNRMITGEDYNILPYTTFNNILKAKAVNRSSSGISRYLDVIDATGKYSSTNIFSQDGIVYLENYTDTVTFQFTSSTEVTNLIETSIKPLINSIPTRHLYYYTTPRNTPMGVPVGVTTIIANLAYKITTVESFDFTSIGALLNTVNTTFIATNSGIGSGTVTRIGHWELIRIENGRSVGTFFSPNYDYLKQGALVKFVAPSGKYFDAQNQLQIGIPADEFQKTTLWASIVKYGTPGSGEATLSIPVPTGAIIDSIIPKFATNWPSSLSVQIANNILSYKTFGLRYSLTAQSWDIVQEADLDNVREFSWAYAGNTSGTGLDASWFVKFSFFDQSYTVISRGYQYLFESAKETRFYFDPDVKVYDSRTATTRKDIIKILRTNSLPDSADPLYYSKSFNVWNKVVGSDGYEDNRKIYITFPDDNVDLVPDNPDLFVDVVAPMVNLNSKYVFFELVTDQYNFYRYDPVFNGTIVTAYETKTEVETALSLYQTGTIFYARLGNPGIPNENVPIFYKSLGTSLEIVNNYIARIGRRDLMFQYTHNAPNNRRIDPSPNNIIDFYLLTKSYSDEYFSYIQDTSNRLTEPVPPTNEELKIEFGSIENFKTISDSIIYNSASFKPLFGSKAPTALQATFKVVKNSNINISDNDVKSQVIVAINDYFNINNWDFGETFYFSELNAYLHTVLVPNVSSIIIVPNSSSATFGELFQINAEPNEIMVSAATVDNVQIISAITAGQIS